MSIHKNMEENFMKKRVLSFILACFMVVSAFIISQPIAHVHAAESETKWTMPTDWSVATTKDANGWVMPYIGNWKLLGYTDLDTATPKLNESTITAADYRAQNLGSGGHGKLPSPYFGVHDNEAAIQNNDSVAYRQGGWYTNWAQRWSGKTFSATSDDSGIYSIAHANKPGAIVFTAPANGEYTFTETVEQILFVAGGTNLSFHVTVRKNGEIVKEVTLTESNANATLSGSVTLAKNDVLMFAFEQTTGVTFSNKQTEHKNNDPNCIKITNVVVEKKASTPSFTPVEYSLPMNWMEPEKILGWYVAKQGNWRLASIDDPSDVSTIKWSEPKAEFVGTDARANEPTPWIENTQLAASRTTFYINPGVRWNGVTMFQSGDHTTNMQVIPSKGVNPSAIFTAPAAGTYTYSEAFNGVDYVKGNTTPYEGMKDANGVAIEVLATVRKNGEILKSFTVKDANRTGLLEGTVELAKGDILSFTFTLTTDATIVNHDKFLFIGETVVTQIAAAPETPEEPVEKVEVELPISFDGTSFKDKLGLVELKGYKNGLYTENMKVEIVDGMWYVYDTTGKNSWQGGGPKQNYQWAGPVDGTVTKIGGHNNLTDSGSALIFTAPYDGEFKLSASLSSAWFNQTTRKAWSDYIIQKYDGEAYVTVTSTDNVDKPDNTTTKLEATVELKKGEQLILIRKPNATAVTHNVSSEGNAAVTIMDANHVCGANTLLNHVEGKPPFCAPGVTEYYECYCGAIYKDAAMTEELVDNGHVWEDGYCDGCGTTCDHAGASAANCQTASVCPTCEKELGGVNKDNHVKPNGVYVNTGKGTHRYNRICCDYSDIAEEECSYGDDYICDKCGYDNSIVVNALTNKKNAFDNVFNGTSHTITVTGPAAGALNDYAVGIEGKELASVSYDLFNLRHDADGNVILRHHFLIKNEGVKIYLNGVEQTATAEGSNYYFIDAPATAGKYHVADEIKIVDGDKSVIYKVSVYSYMKIALADRAGKLSTNQTIFLKTLYDYNESLNSNESLVAMANQTTKKIQVFNINTGNMNTPVWEYNITVGGVSGFKYRNVAPYGDVILVTVGTKAEMASVDTKEIIWQTSNTPGNSHSIDILPNGIIAVGGTVGHCVNFYDLNGADPTKVLYSLPLQHAHGVLWDPEYNVLWVTGGSDLWALDVKLNADGTVTVTKIADMCFTTPDTDTHDLQPYGGDNNKLIVSTHKYIYVFDKETKEFTVLVTQNDVKGVGILPDGDLVYIYPDGLEELWNSTWINRIEPGSEGAPTQIHSDQGRFYKLRVWNPNYQY